ncbi:MAG: hypothetical protein HND58_05630 [Planctomycetota bacterium]|nr:MAG: hypothetical protein HND58_05630 [Planctomycetota bacterium]
MGRSREQLSAEELTELERIAERQRDAAERARRALDSLAERAEALERFDAAQADAMSQAARRGRQERVEQQMREAASQVDQNQTRAAAQGQQAAAEALEQMLEDIDSADEARDEALRRVLASVLDSLESLIDEQEAQIDALAVEQDEGALPALADPMVRLASNTLGLLDEIGTQRDLASVASLVGQASDAQERAVGALREGSRDSADDAERESLSKLQDARMEAERLEEQAQDRESARQRAELRTAYRELLEQQVAIVTDTEPMVGVELDRRARRCGRWVSGRAGWASRSRRCVMRRRNWRRRRCLIWPTGGSRARRVRQKSSCSAGRRTGMFCGGRRRSCGCCSRSWRLWRRRISRRVRASSRPAGAAAAGRAGRRRSCRRLPSSSCCGRCRPRRWSGRGIWTRPGGGRCRRS